MGHTPSCLLGKGLLYTRACFLPCTDVFAFSAGNYVEENLPEHGTQTGKAGETLDSVTMHHLVYIPTHPVRDLAWSWR